MKGLSLEKNNYLKKGYTNEYGLNYYEDCNSYDDYDRFYRTKNNLNVHDKLIDKR